jgi:hypothetical protein
VLTIRVPHVGEELHRWRGKRVVLGELELCGKDAALERCALGTLDQTLPVKEVILGDGAGGDAFGRVVGERAILLEKAAVGGGRHDAGVTSSGRDRGLLMKVGG